ncbi:HlyD family secretion protein [Paradevosia shaoguanensis]|uniref:HlyD family secretion protein n=1 Tax=Paradevosia shaoguanensis TaxID=1335043 RepID=A0AA41QR09_9HYPH|nr:HlyD family secretion protein [Paradevosia shaoguanensis]MCF1744953.1 HlyD family secretion protein [Paradevosia shaoguanensis]MCI0129436.1 HlyD family secretion protein [Paradevosia shaoguanensis]
MSRLHAVQSTGAALEDDRIEPATLEAAPPATLPETAPLPAPAQEEAASKARRRPPAKAIVRILLIFFVLLLGWYVATDRMAPSSSTGAVAAFTTQVAPRVSGEVTEVLVRDNQEVKAGDALFVLDPRPFDLAVKQAEANLAQATQGVDASTASVASAQARVTQAEATLENTRASVARTQSLVERGVAAKAQADKAASDLKSAEAALEAARADLESALFKAGGQGVINPQIQLAQVQLEQAELNRTFATVTAPTDGVITNLRLAVGQFINAGSPAMTFIGAERPWIMVDMRENQLANITAGAEASILFDGQPGRLYEGRVQGIAWGIDPGRTSANGLPQNQATTRWFEPARTIPVHVELLEDWPANVRVGSKVNVLVYAAGDANPIAWIATGLQHLRSYLSFLY